VDLYLQSPNTPPWHGAQLKAQAQGVYILHFYLTCLSLLRQFMISAYTYQKSLNQLTDINETWHDNYTARGYSNFSIFNDLTNNTNMAVMQASDVEVTPAALKCYVVSVKNT
jgi:hypothetical protein